MAVVAIPSYGLYDQWDIIEPYNVIWNLYSGRKKLCTFYHLHAKTWSMCITNYISYIPLTLLGPFCNIDISGLCIKTNSTKCIDKQVIAPLLNSPITNQTITQWS